MRAPIIQNGDVVMENGDVKMIDGDDELAQSVESILKTEQGEFFMDDEFGLSRDNLLGKPADPEAAHDDILEAIMQEPRIATVDQIVFTDNHAARGRLVSLKMTKSEEEGTIELEDIDIDGEEVS